jgi:hypothetical protein
MLLDGAHKRSAVASLCERWTDFLRQEKGVAVYLHEGQGLRRHGGAVGPAL